MKRGSDPKSGQRMIDLHFIALQHMLIACKCNASLHRSADSNGLQVFAIACWNWDDGGGGGGKIKERR